MPRTIESIAANHQAVIARREAGQPAWDETIKIGHIWNDDTLTFTETRDRIVAALRNSRWYKNADPDDFDDVNEVIDFHLAEAPDATEFDCWWDDLYDLADRDRIWIDRF